ncbi:MAG: TatD-related deoxyribonuclease [Bryobacterales bacterium]|nr:TatD-related deoxyribonuclease [Bryobacterales bacterium]
MILVDSHCHLDHEQFASDLGEVLARAADAGVERMLVIGTGDGPPELDRAIVMAAGYPQVLATVGVHPHDASKASAKTFDDLRALVREPKVVALGEIGLDFHYNFSPPEVQREVFLEQLRIARDAGKPVIIHTREAWTETMDVLREHWRGGAGIVHCFTGTAEQALEALDLGFHLGFGGVLTFPKSESVREAARITPEDRLLLETDAPYLAPVPHRGKRNEPAYTAHTARKLAEVRGVDAERIASTTTANFERLCLPALKTNEYTGSSHGTR